MELSNEKLKEYGKRMMLSRMRILNTNGFYGILLMNMRFVIDTSCNTAATDGITIFFSPIFLDSLSDPELDFVMMHEILHAALQHIVRGKDLDDLKFNIACDIVVNSNILLSNNMDISSICIDGEESMHLTPNGEEGYLFSAEEVYTMLPPARNNKLRSDKNGIGDEFEEGRAVQRSGTPSDKRRSSNAYIVDDHSKWGTIEQDSALRDVWVKRVNDAAAAMEIREQSQGRGLVPICIQRVLTELRKPHTDWRTVLNDFIQEEITDYSFYPPDRRYSESSFFLPDFNEKSEFVRNILFMVDTSASMSDDMVTAAYSEIKGAIDCYNGHLCGWVGFFDAAVTEPQPFCDESEFKVIKPSGGGGTDFQIIFEYIAKYMQDDLPSAIIIMTDGYALFPQEKLVMDIPVLWMIVNSNIVPPWGKTTRISV